ncbi:hypothetical protein C7M84_008940 [Penaeus vannamei]|uniref:Uncharacterized protein n=1 Tax=Penaeus vannamei TaxID=6689 RepID=A0A3R7MYE4_PENVA|nr:hypothetical protein C7M84_008940 [Penaeus vannamei]
MGSVPLCLPPSVGLVVVYRAEIRLPWCYGPNSRASHIWCDYYVASWNAILLYHPLLSLIYSNFSDCPSRLPCLLQLPCRPAKPFWRDIFTTSPVSLCQSLLREAYLSASPSSAPSDQLILSALTSVVTIPIYLSESTRGLSTCDVQTYSILLAISSKTHLLSFFDYSPFHSVPSPLLPFPSASLPCLATFYPLLPCPLPCCTSPSFLLSPPCPLPLLPLTLSSCTPSHFSHISPSNSPPYSPTRPLPPLSLSPYSHTYSPLIPILPPPCPPLPLFPSPAHFLSPSLSFSHSFPYPPLFLYSLLLYSPPPYSLLPSLSLSPPPPYPPPRPLSPISPPIPLLPLIPPPLPYLPSSPSLSLSPPPPILSPNQKDFISSHDAPHYAYSSPERQQSGFVLSGTGCQESAASRLSQVCIPDAQTPRRLVSGPLIKPRRILQCPTL